MGRWTSSDPADIAWRREQMSNNNDIAGLARCPRAELFAAKLEAQGLGPADRRAALTEYFSRESAGVVRTTIRPYDDLIQTVKLHQRSICSDISRASFTSLAR